MYKYAYALWAVACASTFAACSADTVGTLFPPSGGGAGGQSGTSGMVDTSVSTGVPGQTSSSGSGTCRAGMKSCGDTCVDIDDPTTGCGAESCAPCDTDHAVAICAQQTCAVDKCVGSWRDCDLVQSNGCEADSVTDPHNCGGCGHECIAPHTGLGECIDGKCTLGACDVGYGNCDTAPGNGCEVDTSASDSNCGSCGAACATGESCDSSNCHLCGEVINPLPSQAEDQKTYPGNGWKAWKYVSKYDQTASSVCIYTGFAGNGINIYYLMADNAGAPGAKIAQGSGPNGNLPLGYKCLNSPGGITLKAGVAYWFATALGVNYGNGAGSPIDVYVSNETYTVFPTVWTYQGKFPVVGYVTASCN